MKTCEHCGRSLCLNRGDVSCDGCGASLPVERRTPVTVYNPNMIDAAAFDRRPGEFTFINVPPRSRISDFMAGVASVGAVFIR